jgi:hypothetical protein
MTKLDDYLNKPVVDLIAESPRTTPDEEKESVEYHAI